MNAVAIPLIFAMLTWWLSTGVIIWLMGKPVHTYKWTALGATIIVIAATIGLVLLRDQTGIQAAYGGFAVGISLWAWHEVMFLLGFITGPRKAPCPANLKTWPRFLISSQTIIHHEIFIAVHGLVILAMSWGADNMVAAWTYFLLWGMRISSKMIVFFGAPNITDTFLPPHLDYLKTYFVKKPAGPFFIMALVLITISTTVIIYQATIAPSGSFQYVGLVMVATLAVLAIFEHLALVLPLPDATLWGWAMRNPNTQQKTMTPSNWRR